MTTVLELIDALVRLACDLVWFAVFIAILYGIITGKLEGISIQWKKP